MPTLFEDNWRNVLAASEGREDRASAEGYIIVSPLGFGFPIIITQYMVNLGEKVHVLEAFKENVHVYAFGKAVGQAVIQGASLEGPTNKEHTVFNSQLLNAYQTKLRALAAAKSGNLVEISGPGDNAVAGVATGLQFQLEGQLSSVIRFTMNLILVDTAIGIGA